MDDRNRAAPVALAREQPVAQPVVHGGAAELALGQPGHDRALALRRAQAVELAGVDQPFTLAVGHEGLAFGRRLVALHDLTDLETELPGELVVTLVVAGTAITAPGAVLHQHVVGHVHRDLLAGDRVQHRAAERHAGLLALLVAALLRRLAQRAVDVLVHLGESFQPEHVGMLRGHDEERGSEQRVGRVVNTG